MNSSPRKGRPTNMSSSTSTGANKDIQKSQKPPDKLSIWDCVLILISFFIPVIFKHVDWNSLINKLLSGEGRRVRLIAEIVGEAILTVIATVLMVIPVSVVVGVLKRICGIEAHYYFGEYYGRDHFAPQEANDSKDD
ncbi:hypothetical protein CNBG 2801, putative [Babesia ovata]|uniref:Uncharacterized protein n=1 Tax=Babesia ovata TaxID=189622 RepID=A0A2H6KBF6_9APIC|nr:hypothetical protein CNBG 2801, putative [Babesia ovata]GBE60333.1 hypothetical protein CNBG 2801, putative [Babesia ovata]